MYRKNRMLRDLLIRFGKKPLILTLALVMTISGAVSGSLAWLTAETAPIKNVFTVGDIRIDLEEDNVDDGSDKENSYEMSLNGVIDKNPVVTVYAGSKDCWLYVKIDESDNFDTFLRYSMANGWTALEGVEGVYYRKVDESEKDQQFHVLLDDKVYVKDTVTKEMLDELAKSGEYPTMIITAYAVQRDGEIAEIASAEKAWPLIAPKAAEISAAAVAATTEPTPAPTVNAPATYAERQAQQKEEGWMAFAKQPEA